jgi:hypothetical protein
MDYARKEYCLKKQFCDRIVSVVLHDFYYSIDKMQKIRNLMLYRIFIIFLSYFICDYEKNDDMAILLSYITDNLRKILLIKKYVFLLVVLLFPVALSAQVTIEDIYREFQTLEAQGRYIDNFSEIGTGEQSAYNLPIGIKKIVGNTPITLAITNMKFGGQYGELTLFMKMDIPQQSKLLIFGAADVRISYSGDLIGDIKLSLLSDISISLGHLGEVVFKGGMDSNTGTSNSRTFVSLACNGDFKELTLDADIILDTNTFVPVSDKSKPVQASFKANIQDWNDLIVELSFPTFEIKGTDGFQFTLLKATLDLSDLRNPTSFHAAPEYFNRYFTLPDMKLWRGLYADEFVVTFPEWFANKNTKERTQLKASRLIIDENGITGENILSLENGDAGGWAFSVSSFELSFLANNLTAFGFNGQINIPISEKSQLRTYEAYIAQNEYLFKASLGEDLDFTLFGDTKSQLESTSYLILELKERRFTPKVVLNGSMKLDIEGLKMEQIIFKKLAVSPETFSVESMGYGGEVKLKNFPISISNMQFQAKNNLASLAFNLKINLMQDKIAAASDLRIHSEYNDGKWRCKGLSINTIKLDNIQMAGFSLDGEIRMEKDNPIYGDYFGGQIKATFGALSDQLKVGVTAVFGTTEFRYWYVEGQVSLGVAGIPVGPVLLTGFTGGAYYRMSATGKSGLDAYAPNGDCSLGLKAGVSYSIGSSVAVNGDAIFEINFLSGGGIKNIHFYGSANFMAALDLTDKLKSLNGLYKNAQAKLKDVSSSLSDALPAGLSGSELTKEILPDLNLSGSVSAYVMMDYDFPSKTFDADFKVMVNVPGGFLRGMGNNNEAGWAKLYCSPQTWYIHVGKPTNPVGLKLSLGSLSLTTTSYFMLGDRLEPPLAPPKQVLDILQISALEADYMKYPENLKLGKGIAFGSRFEFNTGDISFLILYANFMAGIGFDLMLSDMSNYGCEGSRTPVGINGWYANGQCYAYLRGELGVKIKLLSINKRIPAISGSTATMLQARLPNPTWIGGYMAVKLNVLGVITADMKMKFSFGNDCKLVDINGDYSPLNYPVIADLSPLDRSTEVDVFLSPQASFNMALEKPFTLEDEKGEIKQYRIKLEDFYVADNQNRKVEGTFKWNNERTSITFESKEILTPYTDMKVYVSVIFEEQNGYSWSTVNNARETRTASFKTGGAPNYIPLTNIAYCYPIINQRNFHKGEFTAGYIQLKKGQSYLFPANFDYQAVFTSKSGQSVKSGFSYSVANTRIDYTLPSLNPKTEYELSFVASVQGGVQGSAGVIKTTTTIKDGEGEAFSIDYMQQAAQKIIRDGSMNVLDYEFRVSEYNTFEQKLSALQFNYSFRKVNSDVISLLLQVNTNSGYEVFDEIELAGTNYSDNKPLVSVEAIPDDAYYTIDIYPLTYSWYPGYGITVTRDVTLYGIPPDKAFPLYEGYINFLKVNKYDAFLSKLFPYVYELQLYYYLDYYELRNKAANLVVKGNTAEPLKRLVNSQFLFIRMGYYKSRFKYNLPGGKTGSHKDLNYYNELNWRQ